MMDNINDIQQRWLSENLKKRQLWPLTLGSYASLIVHIVFLFIFLIYSVMPMVILNVFSIIVFSIIIYILLKSQSFKLVMALAAAEIYIHQVLAVYYVGWDYNFQLYLLAIPMFFMLGEFKRILMPLIVSMVVLFTLVILYSYTLENQASYSMGEMIHVLPIINLLFTSFLISFYTGIFTASSRLAGDSLIQSQKDIAQLYDAATIDNLTKLKNRMYASSFIEHLIRQSQSEKKPLTIALLDLDNFKQVNDQFGHDNGDRVLQHIAEILESHDEDARLVSRWGGEEFLIALSNCAQSKAQTILEEIRKSIENTPYSNKNICIPLTTTIGASCLTDFDEHKNLSTLLKQADIALYQGKSNQKNQVVFFQA